VTNNDENKTTSPFQGYAMPERATIAAYVSVASLIFFACYMFSLHTDIRRLQDDLSALKTELLRSRMQMPVSEPAQLGYNSGATVHERIQNGLRHEIDMAQAMPSTSYSPNADVKTGMTGVTGVGELSAMMPASDTHESPAEPVAAEPEQPVGAAPVSTPSSASLALSGSGTTNTELMASQQTAPVQPEATGIVEEPLPQAESLVQGQVLWTNPDQQRVMISCGANSGLQPGRRFTIWRGAKYLGEVRISKVFQTMSACDITTPSPLGMRKGDQAKSVDASRTMRGVLLGG